MTQPAVCLSNQLKQVESSGQKLPEKLPEWLLASKGPIGKMLGINFKADGASSSNELERIRLVNLDSLGDGTEKFKNSFPPDWITASTTPWNIRLPPSRDFV